MDKNICGVVKEGLVQLLPPCLELFSFSQGSHRVKSLGLAISDFLGSSRSCLWPAGGAKPSVLPFHYPQLFKVYEGVEEGYSEWSPGKVLPRCFSLMSLAPSSGLKDS